MSMFAGDRGKRARALDYTILLPVTGRACALTGATSGFAHTITSLLWRVEEAPARDLFRSCQG